MILDDTTLPLRPMDRRVLAFMTAHHRGDVPALGEDGYLVPGDGRQRARVLLALLRCADGLDKRNRHVWARVELRGRTLVVNAKGLKDRRVRRKAALLCEVLPLRCRVNAAPQSLAVAA